MNTIAQQFSALGDETRLQILSFLQDGEKCVCEIFPAIQKPQNLVSHHLKTLLGAGFLVSKKVGRNVFYALHPKTFAEMQQFFMPYAEEKSSSPLCDC